jgi:hypothetical protein
VARKSLDQYEAHVDGGHGLQSDRRSVLAIGHRTRALLVNQPSDSNSAVSYIYQAYLQTGDAAIQPALDCLA